MTGIVLVLISIPMDPFSNSQAFSEQALSPRISETYHRVRRELLTSKYLFFDHGIQAILVGTIIVYVAVIRRRGISPIRSRTAIHSIAFALPFVSVVAAIFDLFQGQHRWEFPPWADSLGIPLMGMPIILVILMILSWSIIALYRSTPSADIKFRKVFDRRINLWLAIIFFISALASVDSGLRGSYWFSVPSAMWAFLVSSVAVLRIKSKNEIRSRDTQGLKSKA